MRIRFYGFLAHNHKVEKLNLIREAMGMKEDYQKPAKKSPMELMITFLGENWNRCPVCHKGTMQKSKEIPIIHFCDITKVGLR